MHHPEKDNLKWNAKVEKVSFCNTCTLFSLSVNELILTWLLQHKIPLFLLQNQDCPCCGYGTLDRHHSLVLKPYRAHLWFHMHTLNWPEKKGQLYNKVNMYNWEHHRPVQQLLRLVYTSDRIGCRIWIRSIRSPSIMCKSKNGVISGIRSMTELESQGSEGFLFVPTLLLLQCSTFFLLVTV